MKALLSLLLVISLASCSKISRNDATVFRNCTGTYLKNGDKEYKVCNLEKTDAFADDALVRAKFKKIEGCSGTAAERGACEMFYPYESWIEVVEIK